jgi:hypothetical protein
MNKTKLRLLAIKDISRFPRKKSFWLISSILIPVGVFIAIPSSPADISSPPPAIKSKEIDSMGRGGVPARVSLDAQQLSATYISPVYKTDYEFNAIAPHWKESNSTDDSRVVEMRVSDNGEKWSGWLEIEASGPLRDNDPHPERTFTENPLFIDGQHMQYRISLSRSSLSDPAPEVADLKITYIDSRSRSSGFVEKLSKIKSRIAPRALAGDHGPPIISRAAWGSPDPYGGLYDNTDFDWPPIASPVSQVFIHHTVNSNYQSDPAAVVRGIWEFHTYTRGWGDIGYNFLIGSNGSIYEGRAGGDNVIGGHALGYNTGSLGVAVIGCFDTNDATCNQLNGGATNGPSIPVLHGLTELLAWKTTNFEINPQATQRFCSSAGCVDLFTIAGHRDVNQTGCPGNLLYNSLTFIRNETARKKTAYNYGYSAKQLSYLTANLVSSSNTSVTLTFKNTGSTTWSNSVNRMLLKTANPKDRASAFQHASWINASTPAVLNEATVPPGSTGSFTFTMNQPNNIYGDIYESFRLVPEGVGEIHAFYTLPIAGPVYESAYAGQSNYPLIVKGSQRSASLAYRNTGNQPWYDDTSLGSAPAGTGPVHLATSHPRDRGSAFGASWGSPNRPAVNFAAVYESDGVTLAANQHLVQVGQIARFDFAMSAPTNLAADTYREYFQLVVEGKLFMNDPGTYLDVTVE